MNDLFLMDPNSALAPAPLSVAGPAREDEGPGRGGISLPLSEAFTALAARFDKIEAREDVRDPFDSPDRTGRLLRVLKGDFPDAWERCRASELIDRCPARFLVELVGSRALAEKVADALRFPVEKLN
jgi:hypothetical protein